MKTANVKVFVRRFRDFDAAEDAVQEASIAAVMQWPRDGVPDNPRAWLTQVALRKMADRMRSESARRRRETGMVQEAARVSETGLDAAPVEDDALVLLFMPSGPYAFLRYCFDAARRWRSDHG